MRLITEHDVLIYETDSEYDILDTQDLEIHTQIIPQGSFLDTLRIFLLKKYYSEKNEFIRLVLLKEKGKIAIETTKLNNYEKYDKSNVVCPIERIIGKFCKDKGCWMIIYKRNEYSTKIVSGYHNLILNTRCVSANRDIQYHIDQTINFINRHFRFSDIGIITDTEIANKSDSKIFKMENLLGVLLDFASDQKWCPNVYGKRRLFTLKCSRLTFASLLMLSVVITGNEYRLLQNTNSALHNLNNTLQQIKQAGPYGTPEFFKCIDSIKSPLADFHKLEAFSQPTITGLSWDTKSVRIKGVPNELKKFNTAINAEGYIEIKL